MKFAFRIAGFLVFCISSQLHGAPNAVYRKDISESLSQYLCNKTPDPIPVAQWKQGVYDAQLLGRYLKHPRGKLLSSQLKSQAELIAKNNLHSGYAFFKCNQKMGWVLSTPAPTPILVKSDKISVNASELRRQCRKIEFRFAGSLGGKSLSLMNLNPFRSWNHFDTKKLPAGIFSVSCRPKLDYNIGFRDLYLVPVAGGPKYRIPHSNKIPAKFNQGFEIKFLNWINLIRADHKLKPVILLPQTSMAATKLAFSDSIDHDLNKLKELRRSLNFKGINLIGENRAQGESPFHMAWLMFHSPSHRDLILSNEAKYFGLGLSKKRKNNKYTFVMVMAKKSGF